MWGLKQIEHEIDDSLYFSLQKDFVGTGTRIAAQKLKNAIFNSLKEGNKKVILDFEGVNVVSSSFADELIGKIAAFFPVKRKFPIVIVTFVEETLQFITAAADSHKKAPKPNKA